jgi:putative nucleotidyltransferase with HDIG domain
LQSALDASEAMAQMDRDPFEVVLAEENLLFGTGLELLDIIWERQPATLRFLHSSKPSQDLAMKCVWNSHRLFTDTVTAEAVKDAIERAFEVETWLANEKTRKLVTRLRTFPILPTLYFKLLKELSSAEGSIDTLAALIEQDLAISTKIIQVVNSSLYGVQRQISDLKEAVQLLGFEPVKSLVLAIQVVASEDKVKPLYETIGDVWHHSLTVAALARQLATQVDPSDSALANEAYTAGLLHDLGKLVLESNLGEPYLAALLQAKKRRIPAVLAESEFLGATHAETGAHLAALWGLPKRVVQAIASHHAPAAVKETAFSPLSAVHIANALENEQSPTGAQIMAGSLDQSYVARLGVLNLVEHWRTTLHESAAASRPAKNRASARSAPSRAWLKPVRKTSPKSSLGTTNKAKRVLLFSGATLGIALLACFFTPITSLPSQVASWVKGMSVVHARTPTPAPPAANSTTPAEERPLKNTDPAGSRAPVLALRGIYFQPPRSAALIDGKTVFVGESVNGATILSIDTNSVRLSINGTEQTLRLHSSQAAE